MGKKSTFRSFACDTCDSPLCDQLVFLYSWLKREREDLFDSSSLEEGTWYLDRSKGFGTIKRDGSGRFPAIQPVLKDLKDEASLTEMSKTLEKYIFKHLESIF